MTSTNFEALVAEVEASKVEAEKFFGEKGNAQAGKRLRAHMMEIIKVAKQLRKDVSDIKESRAAAKG